jgi:hypothetical protein
MIERLNVDNPNCFAVKINGKLRGAEYKELIARLESVIKTNDTTNLVMVVQEMEFPEWEAIRADARFGFKDYRNIRRAALVGDQKWVEWAFKLIAPFTRTEERSFRSDQFSEAVQWASS